MSVDSIRRKIAKLRALGEHPASDPNEAAAALAMAQRLMDQHGINEAVLGVEDPEDEQTVEDLREASEPWRSWLVHALCAANGCTSTRNTRSRVCKVFGRRSDVQTVEYLFRYIEREIDRLTRKNCRGLGRGYAADYRKGASQAVIAAIKAEGARVRSEARAQYAQDSRALVALDAWEGRISAALAARAAMFPNLGKGRGRVGIGNASAYRAGQRDGASVYTGNGAKSARLSGGALRLGSGRATPGWLLVLLVVLVGSCRLLDPAQGAVAPYDPSGTHHGEEIEADPWYIPRDAEELALLVEHGEGDAGMYALCLHRGTDADGCPCTPEPYAPAGTPCEER